MAIVQMQKVAILAHRPLRDAIIDQLHEEGVVQVSETPMGTDADHTEMNFHVAELRFAIDVLQEAAPKDILLLLQQPASTEDILQSVRTTDVRGIVDRLHALEEADTAAERRMQDARMTADLLAPWVRLPSPLNTPAQTRTTIRVLGTIPSAQIDACTAALKKRVPRSALDVIGTHGSDTYASATVWKQDVRTFEEIATSVGWTTVTLPLMEGTAREQHEEAIAAIGEAQRQKKQNHEERVRLSPELPALVHVEKYMQWLNEKSRVRESMSHSYATVALLGWMPAAQVDALEEKLHRLSPAVAVLRVKPDEGEEAPVLLANSKLVTPFTSVTTLYGLPLPSEMDPTAALSPFFILFFALCLTDAGYGAVLAIIFGTVLWRTRKSVEESPLVWLLFLSGLVTFAVGILFGGWFGLTPAQVPEFLTRTTPDGQLLFKGQLWNLSEQSGIQFLQYLSLALGLTHLFFGMFLAGWYKWVHGRKREAIWVDFSSHLLFAAIGFFIAAPLFEATAGLTDLARYLLGAALLFAVWGKGYGNPWYLRPIFGVLGLMNLAIGMLSNGLSYLRILALGLVTGAMALAINQVAMEMGKLFPLWLAIPVIIIISVLGHFVSIALNTLGSFIHSGRLQFIEFFSQFFEGGGKPFTPFRRSRL